MLKRMKKYIVAVLAGSVVFGCGANIIMDDIAQDASIATLEKNLNQG